MSTNYLSVQQIANRLGYHAESVRRQIREGKLPALRIGKRLRVSTADIEAFETSHRVAPRHSLRSVINLNK